MSDPFRLNGPQLPQNGLMGGLQSEVAAEATPLLRFVINHAKFFVGAIIILLLAIVAVGGLRWHENSVQREAELALGNIRITTSGMERIKALEKIVGDIPAKMRPGVQLDIAVTALAMQDLPRAAAAYGELAAQDSNGAVGLIAALNQADILQQTNNYAESLTVLNALEVKVPESMRRIVGEGQAICAEQIGDLNLALAKYEEMAKTAEKENIGYIQAKIAKLKAKLANQS